MTDEDVENELKRLQENYAELVVKEDGTVENGDTVVIDFEGFVDGEPFEGGKAENYSLEIGSGTFIPGFEEQLVGMKAGEEKEIQVTFPDEYHAKQLAGKPATFKVQVHEVKAKQLPALDDEFAKDVDEEVETLDELKAKIRARLEEAKKNEAETALRNAVVEKAAANAEMDIPEVMIKNETDRMLREFDQRLQMQGLNLQLYYQFSGQDEASLREQMKEDAEKRVRAALTLEAIAKAENIEVTDEEVNKELEKTGGSLQAERGQAERAARQLRWRQRRFEMAENSRFSCRAQQGCGIIYLKERTRRETFVPCSLSTTMAPERQFSNFSKQITVFSFAFSGTFMVK